MWLNRDLMDHCDWVDVSSKSLKQQAHKVTSIVVLPNMPSIPTITV